jgi:hypothetical protein
VAIVGPWETVGEDATAHEDARRGCTALAAGFVRCLALDPAWAAAAGAAAPLRHWASPAVAAVLGAPPLRREAAAFADAAAAAAACPVLGQLPTAARCALLGASALQQVRSPPRLAPRHCARICSSVRRFLRSAVHRRAARGQVSARALGETPEGHVIGRHIPPAGGAGLHARPPLYLVVQGALEVHIGPRDVGGAVGALDWMPASALGPFLPRKVRAAPRAARRARPPPQRRLRHGVTLGTLSGAVRL